MRDYLNTVNQYRNSEILTDTTYTTAGDRNKRLQSTFLYGMSSKVMRSSIPPSG